MKNSQKIINDTIVDHEGHKRSTQMILGDPGNGYVQGTILDANATSKIVNDKVDSIVDGKENTSKGLISTIYIDQTYVKSGTRL